MSGGGRSLSADLCASVAEALEVRYGQWMRGGERAGATGRIEAGQVEVTLFVEAESGSARWEVCVRVARGTRSEEEALDLALDAADAALGEWLEGGREERPPPIFEEARFRGETVGLRRRRTSPRLEAEADAILQGKRGT